MRPHATQCGVVQCSGARSAVKRWPVGACIVSCRRSEGSGSALRSPEFVAARKFRVQSRQLQTRWSRKTVKAIIRDLEEHAEGTGRVTGSLRDKTNRFETNLSPVPGKARVTYTNSVFVLYNRSNGSLDGPGILKSQHTASRRRHHFNHLNLL